MRNSATSLEVVCGVDKTEIQLSKDKTQNEASQIKTRVGKSCQASRRIGRLQRLETTERVRLLRLSKDRKEDLNDETASQI